MGNPKFKFKELKVYQKLADFADEVYSVTNNSSKRNNMV